MSRLGLNLVLLLVILACAMGVVAAQQRLRAYKAELESLHVVAKEKNIEWGQLQLEQSTLSKHSQIENLASTDLKMFEPDDAHTKIVLPEGIQVPQAISAKGVK